MPTFGRIKTSSPQYLDEMQNRRRAWLSIAALPSGVISLHLLCTVLLYLWRRRVPLNYRKDCKRTIMLELYHAGIGPGDAKGAGCNLLPWICCVKEMQSPAPIGRLIPPRCIEIHCAARFGGGHLRRTSS